MTTHTVSIDVQGFEDKGLVYRQDDDASLGFFKTGEQPNGKTIEVSVKIDGSTLVFFPDRSASHRDILKALGEL